MSLVPNRYYIAQRSGLVEYVLRNPYIPPPDFIWNVVSWHTGRHMDMTMKRLRLQVF